MDLKFMREGKSVIFKIIKFTVLSQKHILFSPNNWKKIAVIWQRLQQSFRLMVGVPDYETYLEHMRTHHPDMTPMDEKTFHQHCIDSRYPSANGKVRRMCCC
ncbi:MULTISPECIES: YbdD/YjiX family protein [unclassified Acinetobacter]|uniref:YbdD/YjiX family protein n=1 Tax=unclassified Acinetobacter TaxID=196816 RepID=UPI0035BA36EC